MPERISHDAAVEILPWLVNGTLENDERNAVREHAQNCVICRRELENLEALATRLAARNDVPVPAPDMRRINARIDAALERERRGAALVAWLRAWSANRWRLAFTLQTAAVLAIAVFAWRYEPAPEYTTLTTPTVLPPGNFLRVAFDPALDAAAIDALLDAHDLVLVDGPSERGVATLGFDDDVTVGARADVRTDLEAEPGVLFVQPVPGEAQ